MNTIIRVVLIVIALGAVVLIALNVTEETYRRYQIQKEIEDLRAQAEKKERDNQKLQGLIQYLKTDDFQEREAKEQLSLQKEGEKVMIIKEENKQEEKKKEEDFISPPPQPQEDRRTNSRKWWDYFFAS